MVAQRQSAAMSLRPGVRVEVVTRLTGSWTGGFEVVGLDSCGCRVRQVSDGAVLSARFDFLEVRREDGQEVDGDTDRR